MSQDLYTLSLDSIKYVLGLISATVDLPTTILDDLNIATNTTYSSYRLDTLLKALKEENIKYCDEAIAGLNKLSKEIVDDSSKVVKENTIYLILTNPVNNVYEQWLLINGTPQMIGTTEMNLDSVYTKQEADARYTLITDFNSLKTKVDGKVDKTNIITVKDSSATDDQVYSAKAINTELDKTNANLGEISELKTTEKTNLVGAINEVVESCGNVISSQILTPLFSEQSGNKVVLYKMGKLRMLSPTSVYPSSRPIMTYFDAYQLPEDSYPLSKMICLMNTSDNAVADLMIQEDGKIRMRYRGEAHYVWIPTLVWLVN